MKNQVHLNLKNNKLYGYAFNRLSEAHLIATEFNQYLNVVLDFTLLKEKLIQVVENYDIINKYSLKKKEKSLKLK